MSNMVIENRIKEKLGNLSVDDNSIVVLKGIPLSVVDSSVGKIDLSDIVTNKLGYFMNIYGKRKFLSYEEFVLMADFVIAQYKEIYILNNNIYMGQYPVEECLNDEIRSGLLNHFAESEKEENDTSYIGDIDEYIAIFDGLKEYNGYLLGAYSEITALQNTKVSTINLFDIINEDIEYCGTNDEDFIDIIEEADYIDFVKVLFAESDELYVRIANYTGDINKLKDRLISIKHYWKDYTDLYFVQAQQIEDEYEHRDEYAEMLKKYWGHSSFRNLPVYDLAKLEQGIKEIKQISQENIIANIVEEVEHCGEGKDFRDVFVTAPTGAGKSVMFQIPAIYLAEKYDLLTIVISPLIGLMNDQVKNLEVKNYPYAETINSDISPIIKQDIIQKVSSDKCHILYISPETLLSRSDVDELIGNRTIGMVVIDEAHIVTTWGKQFRPDYWYLGDHIRKLRNQQMKNEAKERPFVIATFTATAIYHGIEDMYNETINSLHMLSPITYLGYVKREDIDIVINRNQKAKGERVEYELDKFEQIEDLLKRAIITNKKTLIYFPTVALIDRCYEYLRNIHKTEQVAVYHGSMDKDLKQENYESFYEKNKLVMLATKAFGMGIDIEDIEIVAHFAPTGNVCDYVQEIGRAARRADLRGEALYNYNPRDFKHINRLHGLSMIQKYQLVKVIEKIYELYNQSLQTGKKADLTKKRNAMLLDAENFAYIFGSPINDESSDINKVKTALLLIQKDFEAKIGFSPINVRPIPMFSIGFFEIDSKTQSRLLKKYPEVLTEIEPNRHICQVLLKEIWDKDYRTISFPKFKYLLYSKDTENLDFINKYDLTQALCVNVNFADDYNSLFKNIWDSLKGFVGRKVISSEYISISEIADALTQGCVIYKYKAITICEVVLASMDAYRKNYAKATTPIINENTTQNGKTTYRFNVAVNSYFKWVETGFRNIERETQNNKLYLINNSGKRTQEYSTLLGILEALGVLNFEMIGGANSQLYIYINQIQSLRNILNAPYNYNNKLLDTVAERHLISVKMLTYLYEGEFTNAQRWNLLEDYFLGVVPEKVKHECRKENPNIMFE